MGTNRHLDILVGIDEITRAAQVPVGVRHACVACRIGLNGIGVYLAGAEQPLEVAGTTGDEIAELQETMSERSVSEALRQTGRCSYPTWQAEGVCSAGPRSPLPRSPKEWRRCS